MADNISFLHRVEDLHLEQGLNTVAAVNVVSTLRLLAAAITVFASNKRS